MAASLSSPADVVNDALRRIGYRLRVANLFDGSEASGFALDIYGQTRDTMMRGGDWRFCERNVNAVLLKAAPAGGYFPPNAWDPATYPPPPWLFTYEYPDDCLRVRQMKAQPEFAVNPSPQPTLWAELNDNGATPPVRVVACNTADAIMVYAGRVTDPAEWPVDFTEALCAGLARRLAPSLANLDVVRLEAQDEATSTGMAQMVQG